MVARLLVCLLACLLAGRWRSAVFRATGKSLRHSLTHSLTHSLARSHKHGRPCTPTAHQSSLFVRTGLVGDQECQLVELADGTVMVNARNSHLNKTCDCRAVATSVDGGETWGDYHFDPR